MCEILIVIEHLTASGFSESQNCAAESRLAATRLAYESESFAFVDVDRDTVNRLHDALDGIGAEQFIEWTTTAEIEMNFQISNRQ
jgi:hypothetical protein